VGGGWQEIVNNRTTMTAGNNNQREHAMDIEGSNKEGEGGKGDGE
jgi:hypothetical protein